MHDHHEDEHKGRILSRREALATLGGGALAFLAARSVRGANAAKLRSTVATPRAAITSATTSSASNTCIARR